MSGLVGDFQGVRSLEHRLAQLPSVAVATEVAREAAGIITRLARVTFNAGENAYGDTWEPGKTGARITLRRSGKLAAGISYVAIGRILRARLGPPYAKYQVGKRPVFPRNGARLPTAYVAAISRTANAIIRQRLGGRR